MQHHKKVPQGRLSQGLQPQKPPPQKNAPLSAAVESDTVGYTTIAMEAGKWYQIGTPFVALNGEKETVGDVFHAGFTKGDMLYIYDSERGYYSSFLTWGTVQEGAWGDEATWTVSNPVLPAGKAVFIRKSANSTITLSGRVATDVKTLFGNEGKSTWSQGVLVYPADTGINDMQWEGLKEGDTLYVYDPMTQLYKGPLTWTSAVEGTGTPKWCDEATWSVATEKIPVGQALFIQTTGIVSCSPKASH